MKALYTMRVLIRKENREKKKRVDICKVKGESLVLKDLLFIRELNKNPTFLEEYNKTLKGHPKYLYTVL